MFREIKNNTDAVITFMVQLFHEYRYILLTKHLRVEKSIRPYMRYREIGIIEEILQKIKPRKCLEWGSGFSTLYFAKFMAENPQWISIEHDKSWCGEIKKKIRHPNTEIFYVPANGSYHTAACEDDAYTDFKDYIEYPGRFGNFDFILVDGRARKECLIKAHEIIYNNGVIVLHDSNRKYYHEPFSMYKYQVLFTDYQKYNGVPEGGLWIGCNDAPLHNVLNIEKHKKIWSFYNRVGYTLLRV